MGTYYITATGVSGGYSFNIATSGLPEMNGGDVVEASVILKNSSPSVTVFGEFDTTDTRIKLIGNSTFGIQPNSFFEASVTITYDGTGYTFYIITT